MSYNLIWIFLLILQAFVASLPIQDRYDLSVIGIDQNPRSTSHERSNPEEASNSRDEQVISVRITSSVAVGRGKEKLPYRPPIYKYEPDESYHSSNIPAASAELTTLSPKHVDATTEISSDLPPNLMGANIEYIKQLNAKKESKDQSETVHPFQLTAHGQLPNENEPSLSEIASKIYEYDKDVKDIPTARKIPSTSDVNQFHKRNENHAFQLTDINRPLESLYNRNRPINLTTSAFLESPANFEFKINRDGIKKIVNETDTTVADQRIDNKKGIRDINAFASSTDNNYQTDDSIAEPSIKSVEFAKTTATVPPSASYIHSLPNRQLNVEQNNPRLTTVNFNIFHDVTPSSNNHEPSSSYVTTSDIVPNQRKFYDSSKIYSEPAKIYSEPAKLYSEPAKIYSEPAKIYSEPAKIYSEPAKVYSEPAKIYSEPAKFYSEPASLHLNHNNPNIPSAPSNYSPWQSQPSHSFSGNTVNTTPISTITNAYQGGNTQMEHQPEKNYEIDEKISVLTDGRSHGVQESSTEKCKQDNCKVGYVVEGRQYKKYRVEERTADGFIVGEYGVVRNEDGALRGVRYTADGDASPRLIHDALMKFLQLK